MANLKIRHHYRPIEHLRPFTADDGMVWVYDRKGIPPFRQLPKNIAFEKFLYAPGTGPDPKSDAFENWLASDIDTPSVRPLRRLLDGSPLSNVEKLRFSRFLGMQDMRTPRGRDYLLASYQAHLDNWYKSWTSNLPQLQREIYESHAAILSIAELDRSVVEFHPQAEKPDWLNFIQGSVAEATGRILRMRWEIVDAPLGLEFLTSDVGIVKFVGGFAEPCTWRMGFSLGVSHWFVPLSSTRGLALIPSDDLRPVKASGRLIKAVNKRVVLDASRFVFSGKYHDFVGKWWAISGPQPEDFIIPPDLRY